MTKQQIKTAAAIAETLKKDSRIAREVKNYFETPQNLINALGIDGSVNMSGYHNNTRNNGALLIPTLLNHPIR